MIYELKRQQPIPATPPVERVVLDFPVHEFRVLQAAFENHYEDQSWPGPTITQLHLGLVRILEEISK